MELSAVVIMCLNSAPKSAQVLPNCCLVLHLQCVLFLDVLLVAQPSGRRSTENTTSYLRCHRLSQLTQESLLLLLSSKSFQKSQDCGPHDLQ